MTALNYSAGTVSLTTGSAVVTGIDTAWATALLKGGEIFVQAPGNPLPIATIDSDTQITAALKWTGATGVYDYVLRIGTAYDQQIAKNAEILARLLAEIEAGTVWKYDASGDTAGRDLYDNRAKDFSYLDISGEQPVLWVKASNDPGDWAGPFSYGVGPTGPAPSLTFSPVVTGEPGTPASLIVTGNNPKNLAFTIPAGLTGIRWRGAYSAGTSYLERDGVRDNGSTWIALQDTVGNAPPVLPTTANAFWELVSAKGVDGTGTGDVVGPAASVNDRIAVFSGTTGKLMKDGGKTLSEIVPGSNSITNDILADVPTATIKGRVASGAGDPQDLTATQVFSLLKTAGAVARDDIVAAVSQVGGVPTGGIMERGSNANGEYIRFADGTQVCWMTINVTNQAINTAYGSFFQGSRAWNLPAAFAAVPSAACSHFKWGSSASWGAISGASETVVTLRGLDISSRPTGTSTEIGAIAVGRWF